MAVRCDICGKGPQFGHNVSHSKKATRRRWLPNIQKVTVQDGQTSKRLNVCTSCLRTLQKS
ncbi:MAG: 50S ribosomal protein L28 [Chloroflexi bacterium]|nr:50S ribosomal protein L28 [Chloroflexota bacterium]